MSFVKNIVLLCLLCAFILSPAHAGNKNSGIQQSSFAQLLYSFTKEKEAIGNKEGPKLVIFPTSEKMKQDRDKAVRRLWPEGTGKKDLSLHVITELEEKTG